MSFVVYNTSNMSSRTEFLQSLSAKSSEIIIDSHAHAGSEPWNVLRKRVPTSQSIMDMVRKMKSNGVDHSIVFPCPGDPYWFDTARVAFNAEWEFSNKPSETFPYEHVNWTHFNEVNLFGGSFILPFANILPHYEEDKQIEYLQSLVELDTLFGLKIHTLATHTYNFTLGKSKIMEFANGHNLPVMLHTGPDEYSRPMGVLKAAKDFPDIRFCMAHSADFEAETFEKLHETKPHNVFIDVSPHITNCLLAVREKDRKLLKFTFEDPYRALVQLYEAYPDGLLWGTDEPWTTVSDDVNGGVVGLTNYEDEVLLLKNMSDSMRSKIAFYNPVRFLFGDNYVP